MKSTRCLLQNPAPYLTTIHHTFHPSERASLEFDTTLENGKTVEEPAYILADGSPAWNDDRANRS
jgi:hypothetical protein